MMCKVMAGCRIVGGGRIPLYIPVGSFIGWLFSTQPNQRWLDQVTMWGLPDDNADGAEGKIPYIYIWIFVDFFLSRGVKVLECIVSMNV